MAVGDTAATKACERRYQDIMRYRQEESDSKLQQARDAAAAFNERQRLKSAADDAAKAAVVALQQREKERLREEQAFVTRALVAAEESWQRSCSVTLAVVAGQFEAALWRELADPATAMPVDIREEALRRAKALLRARYGLASSLG